MTRASEAFCRRTTSWPCKGCSSGSEQHAALGCGLLQSGSKRAALGRKNRFWRLRPLQRLTGGFSMRSKLYALGVPLLMVLFTSCGSNANCPTCGTTTNGSFTMINTIPVPEHNPTGEPGGPFNSFDISWVDPVHQRFYVSDRIGLAVVVVDTKTNLAVNAIQGVNAVTAAGDQASSCDPSIPPII